METRNTLATLRFPTLLTAALSLYLGLTLWLGALIFFGIGVAPVVFTALPSKDLAGSLNGIILHRLNMIELAGATLAGIYFALAATEFKHTVTYRAGL
ncbi:MAG: DUF4149 domain-containing protein, partial [Bacteroidota bacterium]|nr:DUF4149 domain-containing protein [Candidatus Kapabacteria bacterium]MDW8219997.1 DUF4149 domain-containing protein [Bacteroidota bacterium]